MSEPSLAQQAGSLRQEAQQLRAQGRHVEALVAYDRVAACARAAQDPVLEAQLLIGKIDSLGVLGREDEGISLGRELAATLFVAGYEEDAARAGMNIANLLYRQDRHSEALAEFDICSEVFASRASRALLARAEANAANCLSCLGRLAEAQERLTRAREGFLAEGLEPLAAMAEANQGYLHFLAGSYGPALTALSHARAVFQATSGMELEAAKCTADRADVYHALQLLPEASHDYTEALAALELPYEAARARLGRASVRLALGETALALNDLEGAELTFRAQKNHFFLGRIALLRAQVTGEVREAQKAVRLFVRSGQQGWAAEARLLLAGDSPRKLLAIVRTAKNWSRGWLECRAWRALASVYAQRGKPNDAIQARREAVTVFESVRTQLAAPEELHVSFLTDKAQLYMELIDALLERGRTADRAEALLVLERSRSRLVLERLAQAAPSALPTSERLARLRHELSEAYQRLNGFPDESRRFGGVPTTEALRALEETYHQALHEEELHQSATLPTTALTIQLDTLALKPDEALIAYYGTADFVHAFVLRAGEPIAFLPKLCPQRALVLAGRRLRFHLQRPRTSGVGEVESILGELYDLIFRPLKPLLSNKEKLVFVPHSSVQGLPLAALWDGVEPLTERFECTLATGIALWKEREPLSSPHDAEVLVMGLDAPEIPAALDEARQVAACFSDPHLCLGEAATGEAFTRLAPHCQIIHLATHALFRADNPLFSGLQLADGWLLAHDLYGLRLSAQTVTLSACQTGLATTVGGSESFGLVRAFLAAGAQSIVASLWNADDATTRLLMERFYEQVKQGHTPSGALRSAQQAIRMHFPHPYHWAAFQVFCG
ncbi:CHAT domain-containing protein [Armatimonas rosea]|uniref:CHAT domain-containing protein n=1 Tax=Armatimonas rosea TaxID=685828 RepID=A0A7W9SWD5_ARMRO|nr:CHAT domain-containing protein [Armatimonas rosea]MBB6054082.1 CHAT domain-containing protein [Armatimonas rosea]